MLKAAAPIILMRVFERFFAACFLIQVKTSRRLSVATTVVSHLLLVVRRRRLVFARPRRSPRHQTRDGARVCRNRHRRESRRRLLSRVATRQILTASLRSASRLRLFCSARARGDMISLSSTAVMRATSHAARRRSASRAVCLNGASSRRVDARSQKTMATRRRRCGDQKRVLPRLTFCVRA